MSKKGFIAVTSSFFIVALATTAVYRSVQEKWVALHAARGYQNTGHYEKAASAYHRALSGGVDVNMIIDDLILCYYNTGNVEVLAPLTRFRFGNSEDAADVLELIAGIKYSMGDFYESADTYALAVSAAPKRKYLHVKRARSQFYSGQPEESVISYKIFLDEEEVAVDENM